ncbi:MAG: FGGY family carbohydrate kinase [Anaerolineae bacterium]|nr:FGGY family carbohydrate kinase [Anaerolineae bacterium]MDQ7033725.1 FGGY family carbohydrate kinase [Anaerolineae bacterium]
MTERYLVYDIGTTGTKSTLVEDGQILRSHITTYPTHQGANGVMEQNVEDWIQAVRESTTKMGILANLDGIILTGQMQNVILLDANGHALRSVILYSDTRAHNEATEINELLTSDTLQQITGNQQDAGSLLAKMRWLAKHEPDTLNKTQHLVFGAADAIIAQLCGRFISDSTTASTTGLIDIHSRQIIDTSFLAKVGLENYTALMPEIIVGGSQVGTVTEAASAEWGLPVAIPIYLAPGDAGSATIGAGSGDVGAAYAYIGTSGWVAFTATSPANPQRGVITLAHPRNDHFIQVAPLMTAGGNLDWILSLFDDENYGTLISSALDEKPSKLLYLPYLNGERSPFSDPFARGTFVGLTGQTSKQVMTRAVLEGVIYAYRHVLDILLPEGVSSLMVTGGGTRSTEWCQLFSDIIGLPIHISADAENVGIRGALQAVAVQRQQQTSYSIEDLPISQTLQPQPTFKTLYDNKYQIFRQLHITLQDTFSKLGQLEAT